MKKFEYIKHFGFKLFFVKSMRRICINSDSRIAWKINEYNEKIIDKKLLEIITSSELVVKREIWMEKKNDNVSKEPIWIMWYQGIKNAPDIVRCCINSIIMKNPKHEVIIITEDNFKEYVNLPEFILEKFERGIISKPHLADMIRLYLLYAYGGAWIDATVLNCDTISESYFQKEFYSINFGRKTKDPSHGRWTTFCLFAQPGNSLIGDTLDMHYRYWYSQDLAVDYVMFDYFISYLVKKDAEYSKQVNSIELNNIDVFTLVDKLNEKYNGELPLKDGTILYKLSWKREYHKYLPDVGETNYAVVLKDNNI